MKETQQFLPITKENTTLYTNEQIYRFALEFGCNMKDVYFFIGAKSAILSMKNTKQIKPNVNVITKNDLQRHMVSVFGTSKKFFTDNFNHFINTGFVKNTDGDMFEVISSTELNFDNKEYIVTANFPLHKMKNFNFKTFMKKSVEFHYGKPQASNNSKEVEVISQEEVGRLCQISQAEVSKKTKSLDKIFKFVEVSKDEYLLLHSKNKGKTDSYMRLLHINEANDDRYLAFVGSKLLTSGIIYSYLVADKNNEKKRLKKKRINVKKIVTNKSEVDFEIRTKNELIANRLESQENGDCDTKVVNYFKAFQIKSKSINEALIHLTLVRITNKCIEAIETKTTFRFSNEYLKQRNFNELIKKLNYIIKSLNPFSHGNLSVIKSLVRGFNVVKSYVKENIPHLVEKDVSSFSVLNPNKSIISC